MHMYMCDIRTGGRHCTCTCTCTHACDIHAACCHLMCHVVEVVAICQISSAETRKLFMYLQNSKAHLVSDVYHLLHTLYPYLCFLPPLFLLPPYPQPIYPFPISPLPYSPSTPSLIALSPPISDSPPLHSPLLPSLSTHSLPPTSFTPFYPPPFTLPPPPCPPLPSPPHPPPSPLHPPPPLLQEKLPPLLYHISLASTSLTRTEPSTYVEFSYNRPSESLSPPEMLSVPFTMPWGDKPRCVSLWFCVNKYPLQAQVHLFTAFTGRLYFQIWVCACSGDVTIRWALFSIIMCEGTVLYHIKLPPSWYLYPASSSLPPLWGVSNICTHSMGSDIPPPPSLPNGGTLIFTPPPPSLPYDLRHTPHPLSLMVV